MKVTAQIMKFNTPSKSSGRVYSKDIMEKAIKEFNEKPLKCGTLGSEINHPDLTNISHKIENLRIDEDKVFGDIELLDTPNGITASALLESGIKLALAPKMNLKIEEEKDEEGNTILDENGQPKTYIANAEILSVDIIRDEQKAFEDNTIKVES